MRYLAFSVRSTHDCLAVRVGLATVETRHVFFDIFFVDFHVCFLGSLFFCEVPFFEHVIFESIDFRFWKVSTCKF